MARDPARAGETMSRNTLPAEYVDRPELSETFADSVSALHFDGNNLRLDLCVTRQEESAFSKTRRAKKYPVARLVLSPQGASELYAQLHRAAQTLAKRQKEAADARDAG